VKYVKIDRGGKPVWGVVQGQRVLTLQGTPYEDVPCFDGRNIPMRRCRFLPPCDPTKIVCIGKNYYDHIEEMKSMLDASNNPNKPTIFLKGPNALNSHLGIIEAPDFVQRLDYEGELAVVIKKRAKNVKAENAFEYILGVTCFNDVTARDIQKSDGQWARGKGMDGFAPVGPFLTDEVDPNHVAIRTRLNGEVVQESNTELLITKIGELIEFITASMTLEPGDVIATGTPAGVGSMKPGDVVEVEIDGVGILQNTVGPVEEEGEENQ